jgi:hypothetical protein
LAEKASGVRGESKSHSIWSIRWWLAI